MKLIEVQRKGRILTKAQFGCLGNAYTINVTRGCEFLCAYCYARGYPEAPSPGEVHLYTNLPDKVARELDNPRRRSTIDRVVFNTASDSFQTDPVILDVTYRTMQALLERGVGFSFLTKGLIPPRFIRLFSHHPERVTSRIGLVSMNPRYRDLFEPHTATAAERLQNIERLSGAGLEVEVRIDPLIPFLTDDEVSIGILFEAIAKRGVRRIALSYLHLRPPILEQLRRELPPTEFALLRSCFESQEWSAVGTSTRSKLIPRRLREKGYERIRGISGEFGITPLICSCKNPDLSAHMCSGMDVTRTRAPLHREEQLTLFPC